jgi:hypothetical protein
MILLASPHIVDYQVVQERHSQLRIHLSIAPDIPFDSIVQEVQASAATMLAQYACRAAEMSIEQGLAPLPPGTKRRRVQRVSQ